MTVYSQNGFSANDRTRIASYTIPGTKIRVALRKGPCSVVLLDLAAFVHANVEPLDHGPLDDWGYAERTIRGSSTTLSNHASGTALDLNSTRHPLGKTGTWTPEQRKKIHDRLRFYDGVIRWGGDYTGRPDEMHFEINAGLDAVKRVAAKLRDQEDDMPLNDADLKKIAEAVWSYRSDEQDANGDRWSAHTLLQRCKVLLTEFAQTRKSR